MFLKGYYKMLDYFSPDYYFERFDKISVDFLKENGIKTLLIDIDNTLAPYQQAEPDERVLAWLSELKENGIGFAFVSNNSGGVRVKRFNKSIGAPAYGDSCKPFAKKTVTRALCALSGDIKSSAFLGDQIFTDVWAGKRCGMKTILVPPINDLKNPFFAFKRLLEKPILKHYFKKSIT